MHECMQGGKEEIAVSKGMLASDATRQDLRKGGAEPEDESGY